MSASRDSTPPDQPAPVARRVAPDPFLDAPPPPADNAKAMYTLAAAMGAGTLLIAVGLIVSSVSRSTAHAEAAPMTTTLSEQRRMMRETVQAGKDAQDEQRERTERMRREIDGGDRATTVAKPAAAGGEFVGD